MKFCTRCDMEKDDLLFSKNQIWCKSCYSLYKKQYNIKNKETNKQYAKKYRIDNKRAQKEYRKFYRQKNKEAIAANRNSYVSSKRKIDPIFRINGIISSSINKSLKKQGSSKRGDSKSKYLAYSIQELKIHLENQFESWMNWNNQGVYDGKTWDDNDFTTWVWNIDHIIPRSDLPYSNMSDDNFKKCWSLNNLRPLSAKQNIFKSNRKDNI